eukprot:Blabericola_migrator_1__11354@NODE_671_length_6948_cov_26_318558_g489_i0_p1_GENE_NODE_671_length_6948_cov_26_318558_g489_i0NODE_671_length_6948_cov_26_318558_g489_i0_p1_ORF_typecomplete_len1063_score170_25DAG_kinase_N/PF14513_6/0_015_NODE_671_length_6948_cov_26_318558_g489_i06213809
MVGSGRCVLQAKCQSTSTARSVGLGICCVLSMYGDGAFADDRAHYQDGSSCDTLAKAWLERARFLLAQTSDAQKQPEFWNQVSRVLDEVEKTFPHPFPPEARSTIQELTMVALEWAPLYPCVSQCAKLCYDIMASAEVTQKAADTAKQQLPVAVETPMLLDQHHSQPAVEKWTRLLAFPEFCVSLDQGLSIEEAWEVGNETTTRRYLALVQIAVDRLNADFDQAGRTALTKRRVAKMFSIKEPLRILRTSLSQLRNKSPTLDAQSFAILHKSRTLLMTMRSKLKRSTKICITNRSKTRLNTAIFELSHLWHQARLANMQTDELIRPQDLERIGGEVAEIPTYYSPSRCGAFTTYATLLTTDDDDGKVKEAVDDFLTFSEISNGPIDLTTAKLYLLILLYLNDDNVKLVKAGVQDFLGRLISKLRDEIFETKKTEILLCHIPEWREFCLAYFQASPGQEIDWQDSLRAENPLVQDGHRPIIAKLVQYGYSFCNRLDRLRLSLSLAPNERQSYATHVDSLKACRRHLLSIDSAISVLTDGRTLAYLKQIAAFAKLCLDESGVQGHATSHGQIKVLQVTLDFLQWCRLLASYSGVTSPSLLEETYDTVANALILKSLWSHETTTVLSDFERAFISQGILSALRSNKLDDELLACIKMYLDQNNPSAFVKTLFDEFLIERWHKDTDHDKMVTLLALVCRMDLFRGETACMPISISSLFVEALLGTRLIAKGVTNVSAPDVLLSASLQEHFVAPSAHEAASQLSVDAVIEEALEGTDSNTLTVSEVAHYVATYLLSGSVDEQWLDFLKCQVNWCSLTPQQLAERPGELMTLVRNFSSHLRTFWYKARWVNPFNSRAEATPDFVRHFVNTATLKWLVGKLRGNNVCLAEYWQSLCEVAGNHTSAYMPKWLIFMHEARALFPSGVTVDADFFATLCGDMAHQVHLSPPFGVPVGGPLDNAGVSFFLRHLTEKACLDRLTKQDLIPLLGSYASPTVSRWNSNVFLAFLLYVWHEKSSPMDTAVIERCIKSVVYKFAHSTHGVEPFVGIPVCTMQNCINTLLRTRIFNEAD